MDSDTTNKTPKHYPGSEPGPRNRNARSTSTTETSLHDENLVRADRYRHNSRRYREPRKSSHHKSHGEDQGEHEREKDQSSECCVESCRVQGEIPPWNRSRVLT